MSEKEKSGKGKKTVATGQERAADNRVALLASIASANDDNDSGIASARGVQGMVMLATTPAEGTAVAETIGGIAAQGGTASITFPRVADAETGVKQGNVAQFALLRLFDILYLYLAAGMEEAVAPFARKLLETGALSEDAYIVNAEATLSAEVGGVPTRTMVWEDSTNPIKDGESRWNHLSRVRAKIFEDYCARVARYGDEPCYRTMDGAIVEKIKLKTLPGRGHVVGAIVFPFRPLLRAVMGGDGRRLKFGRVPHGIAGPPVSRPCPSAMEYLRAWFAADVANTGCVPAQRLGAGEHSLVAAAEFVPWLAGMMEPTASGFGPYVPRVRAGPDAHGFGTGTCDLSEPAIAQAFLGYVAAQNAATRASPVRAVLQNRANLSIGLRAVLTAFGPVDSSAEDGFNSVVREMHTNAGFPGDKPAPAIPRWSSVPLPLAQLPLVPITDTAGIVHARATLKFSATAVRGAPKAPRKPRAPKPAARAGGEVLSSDEDEEVAPFVAPPLEAPPPAAASSSSSSSSSFPTPAPKRPSFARVGGGEPKPVPASFAASAAGVNTIPVTARTPDGLELSAPDTREGWELQPLQNGELKWVNLGAGKIVSVTETEIAAAKIKASSASAFLFRPENEQSMQLSEGSLGFMNSPGFQGWGYDTPGSGSQGMYREGGLLSDFATTASQAAIDRDLGFTPQETVVKAAVTVPASAVQGVVDFSEAVAGAPRTLRVGERPAVREDWQNLLE